MRENEGLESIALASAGSSKSPFAVDQSTGKILANALTASDVSDGEVLPELLDPVEEEIHCLTVDSAYDTRACSDRIDQRETHGRIDHQE